MSEETQQKQEDTISILGFRVNREVSIQNVLTLLVVLASGFIWANNIEHRLNNLERVVAESVSYGRDIQAIKTDLAVVKATLDGRKETLRLQNENTSK